MKVFLQSILRTGSLTIKILLAMDKFTIHITGYPINIRFEDGKYRPNADDLARCVCLPVLCTEDTLRKLMNYLSNKQYIEAVRWVTYETDTLFSIAHRQILLFLLVSVTCLVQFSVSIEEMENDLETFRGFISGLMCTIYTKDDILKMVVIEGLGIHN